MQEAATFRVKGLVYQGAREFYATAVIGGLDAVHAELRHPGLEAFWAQHFVPGGWYDILPIVEISRSAAHAAGVPHLRFVRDNAAWVARRDIGGVYRALLKLASPSLVATRLPRAALQYFDFGSAEGNVTGNTLRAWQRGVPEPLGRWLIACVEGFAPVALGAAGAQNVVVRAELPESAGEDRGQRVVNLAYEIRWT